MKFKVGDKVKVRKNLIQGKCYGSELFIGDMENMKGRTVTIKEICSGSYRIEEAGFWWTDEMFENNYFTKSDLKDGDVVTYRNGEKRTIKDEELLTKSKIAVNKLDNYKEDLTNKVGSMNLDIIKVERPVKYKTVFERKEEILDETEKKYLRNVIRPFRDKVRYIKKIKNLSGLFINVKLKEEYINFPYLTDTTMYKNMEINKEYTLEELRTIKE